MSSLSKYEKAVFQAVKKATVHRPASMTRIGVFMGHPSTSAARLVQDEVKTLLNQGYIEETAYGFRPLTRRRQGHDPSYLRGLVSRLVEASSHKLPQDLLAEAYKAVYLAEDDEELIPPRQLCLPHLA